MELFILSLQYQTLVLALEAVVEKLSHLGQSDVKWLSLYYLTVIIFYHAC